MPLLMLLPLLILMKECSKNPGECHQDFLGLNG